MKAETTPLLPWTGSRLMSNASEAELQRAITELRTEAWSKGYDGAKAICSVHVHQGFCLMFGSAIEGAGEKIIAVSNDDEPS